MPPSDELLVSLYGTAVGTLRGRRDAFDFRVDPEGVRRFGLASTVLSVAVPLLTIQPASGLSLRRNYFEEVLAEGRIRERLADSARLDPDNTMALLARYGRDVAGALQVWDPLDPLEPRTPQTAPVTDQRILEMFDEVRTNPLGNHGRRRLSSLAGVQDKVLLARTVDGWAEPLDGYPSTHILKPQSGGHLSVIFDEEYGSRFARGLGLASFDTRIASFAGRSSLVIERYDRTADDERVHQEDFNQILGYRGDEKYETVPDQRLRRMAGVLRQYGSAREQHRLLQMVVLSAALGNLDMHSKNFSVIHSADGELTLAPMYDVVPQLHLPVDQEFALYIARTNDPHAITGGDLLDESLTWRLREPRKLITDTLDQIIEIATREHHLPGAAPALPETVTARARTLLDTMDRSTAASTPLPADRAFPPRTPDGGWGGPLR